MKAEIQDQLKAVADNIRDQRLLVGYSQEYMAYSLSIPVKVYDNLERAHTRISINDLFRIAAILQISASTLVSLPEKKLAYPAINPHTPPPVHDREHLKLHQLL